MAENEHKDTHARRREAGRAGAHTSGRAITRRRMLESGAIATAAFAASAALPTGLTAAAAGTAPGAGVGAGTGTGAHGFDATQHSAFQHGVASGDPLPTSVLLWTRITSHPEDYAGRNSGVDTPVRWEVAKDRAFTDIVSSGTTTAVPQRDMTVKPEAGNLDPYTQYFYRFVITDGPLSGQVSPVGTTRTAPAHDQQLKDLRFALMSCANWEAGYFHVYRDLAGRTDVDYALHVGDYIYEYPVGEYTGKTGTVRPHLPAHEIVSLQDYRERYAQYHTDPDLQAAHAALPWIVTWDDHEVANDQWAGGAENHQPNEGSFQARRDAAIQAYLEWLPIRAIPFSDGGHIYRNLHFGTLVDLNMLDLRTYRNEPPKFLSAKTTDAQDRTMMGSEQFGWLADRLTESRATWNLIGNSVMFSPVLIPPLDPKLTYAITQLLGLPEEGMPYNFDQWDGFAAERRRMIGLLNDKGITNTVWLTGDIHSSWACDVPTQAATYPGSGSPAVEIVCPSITSSNIDDILKLPEANPLSATAENALTAVNRHVRYLDFDRHGYCVLQVTDQFIHADWIFVQADGKLNPQAEMFIGKSMRRYRSGGVVPHDAPISPRA
ncbi:alkaline phosphatase [Corynebacterium sp. 320]|uniref:alkaline phosphatase D family protein n=1 Tax=Corynebacterium TaxID=1716 RepID=UPI00125CB885|nr:MULTISPECIES: alkaline phosphatase D family protein [Corynebacterium]KAB1503207.1 alkaline phosphatase [Corynebacterium sp. 320]KAB1550580.1 alkaline phosphatase [Corynebacterium sp. 321]KAB1550941.1 alkaline phosphatase [Corynebacterium sp. 319]KAB3527004.1 alkaline phosphatase [Corynebacterium sp. 250]KAB3538496.1 alkaline phosphatase [Corynebacterium sp. 366]